MIFSLGMLFLGLLLIILFITALYLFNKVFKKSEKFRKFKKFIFSLFFFNFFIRMFI